MQWPHSSHWQKMYIFGSFKKMDHRTWNGGNVFKKCSSLFFPNMGIKPMFDETYHEENVWIIIGHGIPWGNDFSEELPDTRPLGLELVELRVVRVAFGMLRKNQEIFVWKMGKWEEYCKWRDIYICLWCHLSTSWIFMNIQFVSFERIWFCYSFYSWVSLIHKESFPTLPLQKRFGNDGRCTPGEPNMVGRHQWKGDGTGGVWLGFCRHLHRDALWCRDDRWVISS